MARPYQDDLPDFEYINQIPIVNVAEKIGLEVQDDGTIVCGRIDMHKDDAPAFLTLLSGNKVKCDPCNTGPLSVVDMMMHMGIFREPLQAVQYFAPALRPFDVPTIAKGSHLKNPDCQTVPPACDDPITLLVVPGLWCGLSVTTQRLIPVLLALSKWEELGSHRPIRLSYRAMMRYSGIESPNAIKAALDELEGMGWLERIESPPRGNSPIKDTAEYSLTPLSARVKELADDNAPKFGAAIVAEKPARKRKRQEREQHLRSRRLNF
jgi:DNA-binding HxlR family transcriptional regulator